MEEDIIGKRFGRLVVIAKTGKRQSGAILYDCICDCGNHTLSKAYCLKSGHKKSCGCLQKEKARNRMETDPKLNIPYEKSGLRKFNESKRNAEQGKADFPKKAKAMGIVDGTNVSKIKSKKVPANNTSGYRGVYRRYGKFFACIRFKGKLYHLGYFDKIEDAIKARRKAEEMTFEPFIEWYEKTLKK